MFTYICRQAVYMVTSVYLHLKFTNCRHFMIQTQYSTRKFVFQQDSRRFELEHVWRVCMYLFIFVCLWNSTMYLIWKNRSCFPKNVKIQLECNMHCSIYMLWPPDVQSRPVYIYLYRHQVKRGPQHYLPTSTKPKDSFIYLNKNVNIYEAWCSMFVINLFILPDRVTG